MSSPVFLVAPAGSTLPALASLRPGNLSGPSAVAARLKRRSAGALWIAPGGAAVRWLALALAGTGRRRRGSLVLLDPVADNLLMLFASRFERVVRLPPARLDDAELAEVLARNDRADFCIGGSVDESAGVAILVRGDLSILAAPLADFPPAGDGTAPDFGDFAVIDSGRTLRFGPYESAFDAVLYLHDANYRRRSRDRRAEASPLGGAVRRLRLQRRLRLSDFGALAKTVARIERGEVRLPRRPTVEAIARRLGVAADKLAGF
mgnify:CR=1 FL=1